MSERRIRRLLLAAAMLIVALVGTRQASAGDCFRQLGIGYSAGYNAPAPYVQSPSPSKWCSWLHWKSACCLPGAAQAGCGCGPVAAPCNTCPPPCSTCPTSCFSRGCGTCTTCGPKHPAIY